MTLGNGKYLILLLGNCEQIIESKNSPSTFFRPSTFFSTLDILPSPSTYYPRPSTLDHSQTLTTRTMFEVIKSGGVRYHSTAEPGVGSVDRRMCTNCLNEQADLIFYTSRTSNINI